MDVGGTIRVKITKEGEEIPAKYDTATELGQEVSRESIGTQKGIVFELKY